jgi:hypothetical protein
VTGSPIWSDEHGHPLCRCIPARAPAAGREVPVRFRGFRVEHFRHVGWQAYRVERYVNWCGHGQEVIPVPRADGLVAFVPVLGEAR